MATTTRVERNWADDDDDELEEVITELPPPQTFTNKDGTKTTVSYHINDQGQKVKTTRRIRLVVVKEYVIPRVAERKGWAKFGISARDAPGPAHDTTTVGENIIFRPSVNWRRDEKAAKNAPSADIPGADGSPTTPAAGPDGSVPTDRMVKCRICSGKHFTTRCMFKSTMAPLGEAGSTAVDVAAGMGDEPAAAGLAGGASGGKRASSYVPPAMRPGGAAGDRQGNGAGASGKYGERDDSATLRVTNVSELAEEQELRDMFERFGRVVRVFLAKDRDTGLAKGFAFISFSDRLDAARACTKMDGYGFKHLILKVEFAKKP